MIRIKRVLGLILLNGFISVTVVVAYSPALMNLRPGDESILRAGMSLIIPIFCAFIFIVGNDYLLRDKEYAMEDGHLSDDDIVSVFKEYIHNKVVGSYVRTAIEQSQRFGILVDALNNLINNKFEAESVSWSRYHSVIDNANMHVHNCYNDLATAVISFDYMTWSKKSNYKLDNIPDDLQEKQFKLLQSELDNMNNILSDIENIIYNLNRMKSEMRISTTDETSDTLDTIEKLADELKYYK